MKNNKQGFVIPLLIAIIALLGIGGGAYVYVNNKNADNLENSFKEIAKNQVATTTLPVENNLTNNQIQTTTKSIDNIGDSNEALIKKCNEEKKVLIEQENKNVYKICNDFSMSFDKVNYENARLNYTSETFPRSDTLKQYGFIKDNKVLSLEEGRDNCIEKFIKEMLIGVENYCSEIGNKKVIKQSNIESNSSTTEEQIAYLRATTPQNVSNLLPPIYMNESDAKTIEIEAQVKENLANLRSSAEIKFDSEGGYMNVCSPLGNSQEDSLIIIGFKYINDNLGKDRLICLSKKESWATSIKFNNGVIWCADSTGFMGTISSVINKYSCR